MHSALKAAVVGTCVMLIAASAVAQAPLNAAASMHDNLSALAAAKKPVTIVLKNGTSYRAAIGAVGDHHVVLAAPYQKEAFDVLIAIDEIAAVEVRAREP